MLEFLVSRFVSRSTIAAFFALLILSAPAIFNLTKPGFYTSHDGETHTARIAQYYLALKDGQIPPRFAPNLYAGLGSPIFIYIYPLPYLLGAKLHFLGFSYIASFKILAALSFIFSGFFAYLWLKELFKNHLPALLGSLLYVWVPYRFLLIYVRASISELIAYTFLPLVLYSATKLSQRNNLLWIAILALSQASVMLSQNLVFLISLPLVVAYIAILAVFKKSISYILKAAIAFAWAGAIASFTYLPSLFERQFVWFDETITSNFIDHFVYFKQLIRSPWGYGFDLPGTVNDQMSFQIGLLHLFIFLISLLLLILIFIKKLKHTKEESALALFFIAAFILSVFLMTKSEVSTAIWQKFKILQIIDIPWRLLGITVLSTAFLAAFVAKKLKAPIIVFLLILFVLVANRNHLRINKAIFFDDTFFETYQGTATQYNEFTPKRRQTSRVPIGFNPEEKLKVMEGSVEVNSISSDARGLKAEVIIKSESAKLRLNKIYFPETKVYVNGQESIYTISTANNPDLNTQQDTSGLIVVDLKNGQNKIELEYKETPLRVFATLLTASTMALALITISLNVKKK